MRERATAHAIDTQEPDSVFRGPGSPGHIALGHENVIDTIRSTTHRAGDRASAQDSCPTFAETVEPALKWLKTTGRPKQRGRKGPISRRTAYGYEKAQARQELGSDGCRGLVAMGRQVLQQFFDATVCLERAGLVRTRRAAGAGRRSPPRGSGVGVPVVLVTCG